jgi:ribulose 1,5-bisphosphate synthetase/thiazole synthase
MFCPKCGIGNLSDQKFCRGCGHAVAGHRVALESNFEDAVEKIKSGSMALFVSEKFAVHLAAGATTDPLAQAAQAPVSVTGHTTLNLESPEPASVRARGNPQVDSPSSAS